VTGPPEPASPRRSRVALPASAAVVLASAALLFAFGRSLGLRSPVFAFELHFVLMAAAAVIDRLFAPALRGPRFDVSPREVALYEKLGVGAFLRLLRIVGWTALTRDRNVFDGSRRSLGSYERATRHGENAHTWLFLIVLAPVAWSLARGWWDAAWWIGSMNVLFHAYPVMLQRTQRARLRRLLDRRPPEVVGPDGPDGTGGPVSGPVAG